MLAVIWRVEYLIFTSVFMVHSFLSLLTTSPSLLSLGGTNKPPFELKGGSFDRCPMTAS